VLDPARRSDPGTAFDWAQFKDLVLHGDSPLPDSVARTVPATRIPAPTREAARNAVHLCIP
jgi:N-acetyl-anhydromuramyl-L-alanine amidase AmpD